MFLSRSTTKYFIHGTILISPCATFTLWVILFTSCCLLPKQDGFESLILSLFSDIQERNSPRQVYRLTTQVVSCSLDAAAKLSCAAWSSAYPIRFTSNADMWPVQCWHRCCRLLVSARNLLKFSLRLIKKALVESSWLCKCMHLSNK